MTPRELDPDAGEEVPEGMPQRVDDMLAWVVDRRRASQGQANTKPGATAKTGAAEADWLSLAKHADAALHEALEGRTRYVTRHVAGANRAIASILAATSVAQQAEIRRRIWKYEWKVIAARRIIRRLRRGPKGAAL